MLANMQGAIDRNGPKFVQNRSNMSASNNSEPQFASAFFYNHHILRSSILNSQATAESFKIQSFLYSIPLAICVKHWKLAEERGTERQKIIQSRTQDFCFVWQPLKIRTEFEVIEKTLTRYVPLRHSVVFVKWKIRLTVSHALWTDRLKNGPNFHAKA